MRAINEYIPIQIISELRILTSSGCKKTQWERCIPSKGVFPIPAIVPFFWNSWSISVDPVILFSKHFLPVWRIWFRYVVATKVYIKTGIATSHNTIYTV